MIKQVILTFLSILSTQSFAQKNNISAYHFFKTNKSNIEYDNFGRVDNSFETLAVSPGVGIGYSRVLSEKFLLGGDFNFYQTITYFKVIGNDPSDVPFIIPSMNYSVFEMALKSGVLINISENIKSIPKIEVALVYNQHYNSISEIGSEVDLSNGDIIPYFATGTYPNKFYFLLGGSIDFEYQFDRYSIGIVINKRVGLKTIQNIDIDYGINELKQNQAKITQKGDFTGIGVKVKYWF